jgi:hypothetical protein
VHVYISWSSIQHGNIFWIGMRASAERLTGVMLACCRKLWLRLQCCIPAKGYRHYLEGSPSFVLLGLLCVPPCLVPCHAIDATVAACALSVCVCVCVGRMQVICGARAAKYGSDRHLTSGRMWICCGQTGRRQFELLLSCMFV